MGYLKKDILTPSIAIILILSFVTFWRSSYQEFELRIFDLFHYLNAPKKQIEEIVIVDVDEKSIEKLGNFRHWPRSFYAKVIDFLSQGKAKAIVFDVFFTEPDSFPEIIIHEFLTNTDFTDSLRISQILRKISFDKVLADAIKRSGKVYLAALPLPNAVKLPISMLRENAKGIGVGLIMPEADGIVRRYPLIFSTRDSTYLTLAARVAIDLMKDSLKILKSKSIFIKFFKFRDISFYDVLKRRLPAEFFKDKIIFIGGSAKGLFDIKPVASGGRYPGVKIHASALYSLLKNSMIKKISNPFIFLLSLLCGFITIFCVMNLPPLGGGIFALLFGFLFFYISYLFFAKYNLWIEVVRPTYCIFFGFAITALQKFLTEQREKNKIRGLFRRFVDEPVIQILTEKREIDEKTAERKVLTVMFADIRGFTSLSEKLPPEEVLKMLNIYHSKMTDIIFSEGGTVDKFIGDGIMAIFGAPIYYHDHALRAVRTAIKMVETVKEMKLGIRIGVGINTGEMVCGFVGSEKRLDYTVIGDNVNLAARLEPLTKEFKKEIIISEMTYKEVRGFVEAEDLGYVKIRGKELPVKVYAVKKLL